MSEAPLLRINPGLDLASLRQSYEQEGRVRVARVLSAGAPELYYKLEAEDAWVQLINRDVGAHELPWTEWSRPGSARRPQIEPEMFERARHGFQYSYAALRVPAPGEHCDNALVATIAELMVTSSMLEMLEAVTGIAAPTFTDGQVTAYGEGDFLTGHDDNLVGARRKAAFVLGLTPQWRLEWGGLLLFHEPGTIECTGLVPQFNTLDLFRVPTYHSVSQITRAAPRRRFSITGWLSAE